MAPLLRSVDGEAVARRLDISGLVLIGLTALWTVIASLGRSSARPFPVLGLLAALTAMALIGRRWSGHQVPGLVAVSVTGALVLGFPDVLRAGGGPTGYANANATVASMAAVAAAATVAAAPQRDRLRWVVVAVALIVAVPATRSVAGVLTLGASAMLALASTVLRSVVPAVLGGLVAVSLTLGVTIAVADGGNPLGLGERAALRADLWASALDALRDEPLRGLGPGAYEERAALSPDDDFRWAHHGYLQQGAEQGIPGLLLVLALLGWASVRLWRAAAADQARAVAGASVLTVLALHASVDHVLHHAAAPLVGALLFGWATRGPDRRLPPAAAAQA
ncbi:MAG: O-antigen ligase family protein [Acidimicrobiales bacterium]